MTREDVKVVITALQKKPYLISDTEIFTDNGYVVIRKEDYEKMQKAGAE